MNAQPADSSMITPAALVVFCRRPAPGVGKRRIARSLGDAATHELAGQLLATTCEDAASWSGPVILAPATAADEAWARALLPGLAHVIPQPDGNLGERIQAVDTAVRTLGYSRVVIIGSDAPALTPDHFDSARAMLAHADVVLGPAADGGVTLMASNCPWPELAELPWSSDQLGSALGRACTDAGLRVADIDGSYDVDRVQDLDRLAADLADDARPARRKLHAWLTRNAEPSISLVIPVLDDHHALVELLRTIRTLEPPPAEVIVVDAGADDRVASTCNRFGCTRLQTRAGRGHQLHAGALRASGDILWFLHADARPDPGAVAEIRDRMQTGAAGGFFRFRFTGSPAWHKSALAALINIRCRFGVPYGDQGLFVRRSVYVASPGFADAPLFEEIPLVRAARAAGPFAALNATVGVSPRRWERDGWLRRTLHNRLLALGYMLGVPPERLARRYDGDRESARC